MVSEAEIIGKSHFKLSHSTPQVRSYPKGEAEAKKASTFAVENGQEPSEEPDDLPDIDEIPLTYESSDAPSFEEEEEELIFLLDIQKKECSLLLNQRLSYLFQLVKCMQRKAANNQLCPNCIISPA